jgi:hypothetical protein
MEIIDPTQYPNWDQLLLSTPGSSFFHTSSWAKVLKEAYGYSPKYFTEFDGGQISILIPVMEVKNILNGRRGVSLPFTDYCEPIIQNGNKFQDLINSIAEYGKKANWKYFELRGRKDLFPFSLPSCTYLAHTLNLSRNAEEIFSDFRDSTKRNIKKAIKNGVEVKINNSFESIKEFCRLNCVTRKRHGIPPQPFLFFKKVFEYIISNQRGFVVLASFKDRYIAGAVFFLSGDTAIFKYGASDKKYHHLRANNLVMWEAIKWSCQNGFKHFCFGRSEPGNKGLLQFKSGWGTIEQKINYYRYDLKKGSFVSDSSKLTGFRNRVFRNMPLPLLKKLGSVLYKYVG